MPTKWLLIFTVIYTTLNVPTLNASERIEVVSDSWINFVSADGSGYYLDLLREVFPSPEFELNVSIQPYSRALNTMKRGKADIILGIWANEHPTALLSQAPVEVDLYDALMRKSFSDITDIQSINQFRVITRVGYGIDEIIDNPVSYGEHIELEAMINMITHGHADVLFDFHEDMEPVLKRKNLINSTVIKRNVLAQYAYFGFCSSPKCLTFKQQFDQRYLVLHQKGIVKKLLIKNKQPLKSIPPYEDIENK